MKKILIVEDNEALRNELTTLLQNNGYAVAAVTDFSNTAERLIKTSADLILLDILLPNEDGESILQKLRRERNTPVIMLTSQTEAKDELNSMISGADDYVKKPFNPEILLLRIAAVLKRAGNSDPIREYRSIKVNALNGKTAYNDKEVELTKKELIIFLTLLEHQGEVVTREDLITALWAEAAYITDNAISVNVRRLRNKLYELGAPDVIKTTHGQGYTLE